MKQLWERTVNKGQGEGGRMQSLTDLSGMSTRGGRLLSYNMTPHQSENNHDEWVGKWRRQESRKEGTNISVWEGSPTQTTEFQQIEKPPKKEGFRKYKVLGLQTCTFHWYKLAFWRVTIVSKLILGVGGTVWRRFPPLVYHSIVFFFLSFCTSFLAHLFTLSRSVITVHSGWKPNHTPSNRWLHPPLAECDNLKLYVPQGYKCMYDYCFCICLF